MSEKRDTKELIITKAFENWANKTWFQIVMIIAFFYLLIAPIVGPIVYNYINRLNTSEAVVQSLEEREKQIKEQHKLEFERAKQVYATAKNVMKEYLTTTSSDYIFFIEYHNGVENVQTGLQFCRFDITLEVLRDNLHYVNHEKFKDDIVARYDIMLDPEFENSSKAFYFKTNDLESVDRYLMQQLLYLNGKSCAVINVANERDIIIGTLLFVSLDENINITEVYKCQREIEKVFQKIRYRGNVD